MNTMTGSRVAGGQAGRRAGGQGTGAASSGLRATSSSRERLGLAWASGTSKPTPVTPFPTRPHLLILPQQSTNFGCLVETEHSNTWVYGGGGILLQITTYKTWPEALLGLLPGTAELAGSRKGSWLVVVRMHYVHQKVHSRASSSDPRLSETKLALWGYMSCKLGQVNLWDRIRDALKTGGRGS